MPRDITITFEDGTTHVYRGAPDGVTPEQVSARAAQEFGKGVASLDGGRKPGIVDTIKQQAGNILGGAVRGAASIGATLTTPVAVYDAQGNKDARSFLERRASTLGEVDAGLKTAGADPSSLGYRGSKLLTEIAGTSGVGGAVANTVRAVAPAAAATPTIANLLQAIQTSGMSAGNATGAANALTRAAGGAINGGLSAGLVDPENAGTGAAVGGVLPGALQLAGKAGNAIGSVFRSKPGNPQVLQAAQDAAKSGYVIPPSDIRPQGAVMELLGGLSGKIKTAQEASARNQGVTNSLAKKAVGLADDAPLTREALADIRAAAGQAYGAVASTGQIAPPASYAAALDKITAPFKTAAAGFPNAKPSPIIAEIESLKSPAFDAASAVEKIKELRALADDAYGAGGNKALGKAYKQAAGALEDAIDGHLQAIGAPADMLQAFRDARVLIAKTHTLEGALNGGTGDVSAAALAGRLKRGKALSGELEAIAKTGEAFPKATQALKEAPKAVSPLDWAVGLGSTASTGNPLALAGLVARPGVRSLLLSQAVQRSAMSPAQQNAIQRLLANPDLAQFGYRAAPVIAADRQ